MEGLVDMSGRGSFDFSNFARVSITACRENWLMHTVDAAQTQQYDACMHTVLQACFPTAELSS